MNQRKYESPVSGLRQSVYTLVPQVQSVLLDNSHKKDTSLLKSRCNELKSSLIQATSNLDIVNYKREKALELDQKAQEINISNSRLMIENDKLCQNLQQKNLETEIWKNKYEQQLNQLIGLKSGYETQVQNLKQSIQLIKQTQDNSNIQKVKQLEEKKGNSQVNSNNTYNQLKASHINSMQLFDEQLQKLNNIVEEREKQIQVLQIKVQQNQNTNDLQINRLQEERETLRLNMSKLELQLQKELELQKKRQMEQMNDLLENQNKHHSNQVDVLNSEIQNIKNLLQIKNQEIQQVIQQGEKIKQNFNEDQNQLKKEIENLKERLYQENNQKELEIKQLLQKMNNFKQQQLQGVEFLGNNQIQALQDEITHLNNVVYSKSEEIEQQIKEKNQYKENQDSDVLRLQNDIDTWKLKLLELQNRKEKQISDEQVNNQQNIQIQNEIIKQQKIQLEHLSLEIDNLNRLLQGKNDEMARNLNQFNLAKDLKEKDLDSKTNYQEELQYKSQQDDKEFNSKLIQLSDQLNQTQCDLTALDTVYTQEISSLKDKLQQLTSKLQENSQLADQYLNERYVLELDQRKLWQEINKLKDQLIQIDKQKVKEYSSLRQQYEQHNKNEIQSQENQHVQKVQALNSRIQDLTVILQGREYESQRQLQEYENLQNVLLDHQATNYNNSKFDQTLTGLGASLITKKNIQDVKLQTYLQISQRPI